METDTIGYRSRLRRLRMVAALAFATLLCAGAAQASVIRYTFTNMAAIQGRTGNVVVGPQTVAGYIDVSVEKYLSPEGIDIDFATWSEPTRDWAALGVRDFLFNFDRWAAPNAITLDDLVQTQGYSELVWFLSLTIPGGPDDATNPTRMPSSLGFFLVDDLALIELGFTEADLRLSGVYYYTDDGPCTVFADDGSPTAGCNARGTLSGPVAVPEPGSLGLLAAGLLGVAVVRRGAHKRAR